jgi:hypothetical protein
LEALEHCSKSDRVVELIRTLAGESLDDFTILIALDLMIRIAPETYSQSEKGL